MNKITTKFGEFINESMYANFNGDIAKLIDIAIRIHPIELAVAVVKIAKEWYNNNLNVENPEWQAAIAKFHEATKDAHSNSLDDASIDAVFEFAFEMDHIKVAIAVINVLKELRPQIAKEPAYIEGIKKFHEKFKDQLGGK